MRYKPKYFNYEEFEDSDEPGSGELINDKLLELLDNARAAFGQPIIINSGVRLPARNKRVGGAIQSSHLLGLAVDLRIPTALLFKELQSEQNSRERFKILQQSENKGTAIASLLEDGATRFGISKNNWIHFDIDKKKAPSVCWLY